MEVTTQSTQRLIIEALESFAASAEAGRRQRGEEIVTRGEVRNVIPPVHDGNRVRVEAQCHGYAVRVSLEGGAVHGECDCPDARKRRGTCKHQVALALAAAEMLRQGLLRMDAPASPPVPDGALSLRAQIAQAIDAVVEARAQELAQRLAAPDAEPVLLLGPSGCGKTAAARRAAELLGAQLEEVQLAPSWTDADLLGIRSEQLTYVGPVARAFARALIGEQTVVLFLDEFLRAPQRVQDGLMRAMLPVPASTAQAMGIPTHAPVAVAEAPLFGRVHAPWERVKWVLAANPWGAPLDPALLDRVQVWQFGFSRALLSALPEQARRLVEYSWAAAEKCELPVGISFRLLLREPDALEQPQVLRARWIDRLRLIDPAAADIAQSATEGLV